MKDIKQFFDGYADVVLKIDIIKIAGHFHDRFLLSTRKELWYIKNDDEFRENLKKAFSGYKKLGAETCKLLALEIIEFKSNHYLANVQWGLFNTQQDLLIQFDISYCIKQICTDWKFIFVIDHNEIERIEEFQQRKEQ